LAERVSTEKMNNISENAVGFSQREEGLGEEMLFNKFQMKVMSWDFSKFYCKRRVQASYICMRHCSGDLS